MTRPSAAALLAALGLFPAPLAAQHAARPDTAEARALFQANLDAINRRDRARYLASYLDSPALAINGPAGLRLGYAPFAAQRDRRGRRSGRGGE